MKPALADAYDRLMDRAGTAPLLAALADIAPGRTLPITDLLPAVSALGGPSRLGPLRDQLMALQPLLLRVEPGTDEERVGFRHPEIAAHVRTREPDRSAGTTNDPHCTVAELSLFIDGETSASTETREHLDECIFCRETYAALEKIKQKVARCAGGEHAPEELRSRLIASVRQTVAKRGGYSVDPARAPNTPEPGTLQ